MESGSTQDPSRSRRLWSPLESFECKYKGEERIMKMFQQPVNNDPRSVRGFVSMQKPAPNLSVGNALSDKARLYRELGFVYNASGSDYPDPYKKKSLVYKPRRDNNSFLAGILGQEDRIRPIQADGLMWIDRPPKKQTPSIWFIREESNGTFKALRCKPDPLAVRTEEKKEGITRTQLWTCSRWFVVPATPPDNVLGVVQFLKKRFHVPHNVTVDCFGDQVFDVHSSILVSGLDFDQSHMIELTLGLTKDRPFFDKVVTNMIVTKMN